MLMASRAGLSGQGQRPSHSLSTSQTQRAVTMAGTSSRATATGTLPIGGRGRMPRGTAVAELAT